MDKMRTDDGKLRYALYLTYEELVCVEYFLNGNTKRLRTLDVAKLEMKRQINAKVQEMIHELLEDWGK